MKWPEQPTCHTPRRNYSPFKVEAVVWHPPENTPNGRPFRSCSYCGSIHPEDLLKYLEAGGRIEQADWKYGYPHKFYINDVPNPRAGESCEMGWSSKDGKQEVTMGPAPATLFIKWYNDHLLDQGYDEEARDLLCKSLEPSGVKFFFDGPNLCFKKQPREPNAE